MEGSPSSWAAQLALQCPGVGTSTCSTNPQPGLGTPARPASPWHLGLSVRWPSLHLPGQARMGSASAPPAQPPSSRAAQFPVQQYSEGGTGGELSAELPPGLGLGRRLERQSPVSWLPVLSGPGLRPRNGDTTPSPGPSRDPGPHLNAFWGWWQEGSNRGVRVQEPPYPNFCTDFPPPT